MSDGGHPPTLSERAYRVLLKAYPKEFREEYGAQMEQAFGDLRRQEVRRAGTGALVVLWVRTFVDLLISASAERGRTVVPALSSTRLIRFGGFAAMAGGALSAALILRDFAAPYPGPAGSPGWLLYEVLDLVGVVGVLLISGGALGLYACVAGRSRKLAIVGLVLVCVSSVGLVGAELYESLVVPSSGYPEGTPAVYVFVGVAAAVADLAGFLMLGAALLKTRAMGRWSALPLIVGMVPLAAPFLALALSAGSGGTLGDAQSLYVLFVLPAFLSNLGWVLLGYLLWSGRSRGTAGPARVA